MLLSNQSSVADVAVIIPTYNRLPFLKKAIQSVLDQQLLPRELIIVDDGSTDGTLDYLNQLKVANLKVLTTSQAGPGVARNYGVRHCRSSWLAFLDSDDYWLPAKILTQLNFFDKNPDYKICQTEEIWIRRGVRVNPKLKHQKPSGNIFLECLKLCLISPSAVMIKKDFFEELGGFDESFFVCEDYELWLRVTLKEKVMTLPEALVVKQGGHEDQLSRKFWGMDRFRVQALEKVLKTEVLNHEQRMAVLEEITFKIKVLAKGFEKRHSSHENPYLEKLKSLDESLTR